MVFSELTFLFLFLPFTLLIYYSVPFKFKNFILLLTGIIFYSFGEPVYVLVMLLSTAIDYTAGRIIDRFENNNTIRKLTLIISIIINLSLLGVFKYGTMIIESINQAFDLSLHNPNLPLPIGISFFTFQSMSYTIDLYRKNIPVQKNFISFAAFVTMFPQIVAGPIVKYESIKNELVSRKITSLKISDGIRRFICGLAKKVLIANSLGEVWSVVKVSEYTSLSCATAWFGILCFTFQIYFDFSGYSDMAVGLGKMLGFEFPENFNFPYLSKSVSQFWRRWHITLGDWFKNYLYIPLGGNKKGTLRTIFNLFVVWLLTGLWHGASWNFVIWGGYFGILIILEKFLFKNILLSLPKFFQVMITFSAVIFGWLIFEMTDISLIPDYLGAMINIKNLFDSSSVYYLFHYSIIFITAFLIAFKIPQKLIAYLKSLSCFKKSYPYISSSGEIFTFLICIFYLVNAGYNPFLYFNF